MTESRGDAASILVVDDDQRNVRLVESILRTHGYTVLQAYDGDEALQIVPPNMRSEAKVIALNAFSMDYIERILSTHRP